MAGDLSELCTPIFKKMKNIRRLVLLLITTAMLYSPAVGQDPVYVGITAKKFNYFAASQKNSEWCWAASIQMMFNYYGIDITQEQIVSRSFNKGPDDELPNVTGDLEVITANLNNRIIDNKGLVYQVKARLNFGPPAPAYLVKELAAERPVLIGYKTGPNSGHAVLVTACSYIPTRNGPQIRSVIVRDPWPSPENLKSAGRVEYWGHSLARLIETHWYVQVDPAAEYSLQ
jgi:hypothetical protein